MHVNKKRKTDKVVVLFLAGLFCAGAAVGATTATLIVTADKPAVVSEVETPPTVSEIETPTESEPEQEETTSDTEPEDVVDVHYLGKFKLTAYCICEVCCGKWADGITYTGTQATPGRTIAVDPEVIPLGSTVFINGTTYIAEDIGGVIKGERIDVLFPTHQEALDFGVQYADISIIKKIK